jgi:chromosomal replication initiator protein
MLDDVQFIAGKPSVQEEFFHTFNTLLREGGQVVMTSDKPPEEISKLEERLRSRFGAGLIVDIGAADFELRTAILLIKAKQRDFDLSMELAQLIAENVEG